jgi:polyhydroxybutyrate depolymerase
MTRSHERLRLCTVLTALSLTLVACQQSAVGSHPTPNPSATSTPRGVSATPGDSDYSLTLDGMPGDFVVHIPPGYDRKTPAALVVVLHGGSESIAQMETQTGMSDEADRKGFVVVYPHSLGPDWHAGTFCCAGAGGGDPDIDVRFVKAVIAAVEQALAIDPRRIYATGFSAGAVLIYRLGAELSDTLAAIAPVGGAIGGRYGPDQPLDVIPAPSQPVSVIVFHGKQDSYVPYAGGQGSNRFSGPTVWLSVADAMTFWAQHDHCGATPKTLVSANGNIVQTSYSGCTSGASVVFYTVVDGDHTWPGGQPGVVPNVAPATHDISATDLMWSFFALHPKQP